MLETRRCEWKCFINLLGGDSASPTPRPSHALPARPAFLRGLSFPKPFSILRPLRPGGDRLSVLADNVQRPNRRSHAATSRHTRHPGTGGAGRAGELGHPRPGDDDLAAATGLPVAVSGAP